jgi:hypothetical protein
MATTNKAAANTGEKWLAVVQLLNQMLPEPKTGSAMVMHTDQ